MEGEVRLVPLFTAAFQRVAIGLTRAPQVRGVEIAFPIQHLREPERDRRSRGTAHPQPRPPSEVLAEIEDRLPRWGSVDRNGTELPYATDWWGFRSQESGFRGIEPHNRRPLTIIVRRTTPPGTLRARVIGLAAVDVGGEDRAGSGLPGRVGRDALDLPVLIDDLELHAKPDPLAVHVAAAIKPELTTVPAIAQHGFNGRRNVYGKRVGLDRKSTRLNSSHVE